MLTRKVAVVTGASTGIGRAIACALASEGARIALLARSRPRLEEVKDMIAKAGGEAMVFPCDLRKPEAIHNAATGIADQFGAVDILVNCAGVWHNEEKVYAGVPLQDTPADEILEVMQVGAIAPLLLTRALLPGMIKKRSGKIIQISGTFESGASGWLHYYASKKTIEHFSEGLAQELRQHEIQVNTISPSDTLTDAYKRFFPDSAPESCLKPEDIAKLAVFLASSASDHITGACIVVRSKSAR